MTPQEFLGHERWLNGLTLDTIRRMFREQGADQLFCKVLGTNNNSKQQIYVAQDVSEMAWIPTGSVEPVPSTSGKGTGRRGPIFRFPVRMAWITPGGAVEPVRAAKLIAYPQYPEVRLSGFLAGADNAPSFLMNENQRGHDPGRLLFLAPRHDGTLFALCVPPESAAAREFASLDIPDRRGVFARLRLDTQSSRSGLEELMERLCSIHRQGWISARILGKDGIERDCRGSNCGGYTLEARLGIQANGVAEPDFMEWELKTRAVPDIDRPGTSTVTLMTPEPDGGAYVTQGIGSFIRHWGYRDKQGRPDRLNFGGIYRCGMQAHADTHLAMHLEGYDGDSGTFTGAGALLLADAGGTVAASWSFAKLLDHWKRKHTHTAYIPCQMRRKPGLEYRYGNEITLAEGAEFRRFLRALMRGTVYYDPGIKLEGVSSPAPKTKRRSQLRVKSTDLGALYSSMRIERACRGEASDQEDI